MTTQIVPPEPEAATDPEAPSKPSNDKLKFRVTRTEATAIALHVELLKREGKPVPKWMRQIAAAV